MTTTSLTLGSEPDSLTVVLVRDADFIAGLDSLDGDWPDGVVVSIVFNDDDATAWTAAVDAAALDWNVDKAAVNALLDRLPEDRAAELTYVDGATDLLWAEGPVKIRGRR